MARPRAECGKHAPYRSLPPRRWHNCRLSWGRTSSEDWLCLRLSGSLPLAYVQLSAALFGIRLWLYFTWCESRGGP